ncbi:MAG: hypothetical protein K0S20_540 [Patescibacteria group bacterium]|jgi:hypothetical protein|nr:hypothetical protein [Patescibacteria group bacterium]
MISFSDLFVQKAWAASQLIEPVASGGKSSGQTLAALYGTIFEILTVVAGAIAVLYLVWAGMQYISAGGSPEKAKTARGAIISGIIGVVIIIAAYTLVRIGTSIGNQLNNSTQLATPTNTEDDDAIAPGGTVTLAPGGTFTATKAQNIIAPGAGTVKRANGSTETITAGQKVTLQPGDSLTLTNGGSFATPEGGTVSNPEEKKDGYATISYKVYNLDNGYEVTAPVLLKINGGATASKSGETFTLDTSKPTIQITAIPQENGYYFPCTASAAHVPGKNVLKVRISSASVRVCSASFETATPISPIPEPEETGAYFTFQAFNLGGRPIDDPIDLMINGYLLANRSGDSFYLNNPELPSVIVATPKSGLYRPCSATATPSTQKKVLKIRFALTENQQCAATYEGATSAPSVTLTVSAFDTTTSEPLKDFRFAIKEKGSTNYRGIGMSNITIDPRGTYDFQIEKDGYFSCEERYDFQYSGPFTVWLTPSDKAPPLNADGGLNDTLRCHYSPDIRL